MTEENRTPLIIVLVISIVLAIIIVNWVQRMYMKLMGAEIMFFNGRKKLIGISIVSVIIFGLIAKLFGLV